MEEDELGSPQFVSPEEEAKHWRNLALQFRKKMLEAREELDEFQEHSRELEQELETQLEQADKRTRDLRALTSRVTQENEILKDRVEQIQHEFHSQLTALEAEIDKHRSREEEWHKYIRELEQANDDLERSQRVMLVSVEDFEGKLNSAIERNAFLESELDEKESLRTMVQRLKDETRDLKQELKIRERAPDSENKKCLDLVRATMDSNKLVSKFDPQTPPPGSPFKLTQQNGATSPALTPSARISALNIVGDLLRSVGTLESKVSLVRNYPKDSSQLGESPRFRRSSPRVTSSISTPPSSNPSTASPTVQGLIRA